MSDAYRVVARIQDQDDFQAGLTDGYGLRWNDSTSKFELVSFARRDEANTFTGQLHVNYGDADEALKVTYTGGGAAAIDISGGMFHMEGGTACLLTTGDFVSFGLGKHGDTDTESIRLGWDSGSSSYQIVTEKTGTGTIRGFKLTAAGMTVLPSAANVVPMTVKGAASQSANLQEWQNGSGTVLSAIASDGTFGIWNSGTQALKLTNSGNNGIITGRYGNVNLIIGDGGQFATFSTTNSTINLNTGIYSSSNVLDVAGHLVGRGRSPPV